MVKSFEGFFSKKVKKPDPTPDPIVELEKWVRSNENFQNIELVENHVRGLTIEFTCRGEKIILFDPYFSTTSGGLCNISAVVGNKFIGRISSIGILLNALDRSIDSLKRERQGVKIESEFKKELDLDYIKDLLVDLFDLDVVSKIDYYGSIGIDTHLCFWIVQINLPLTGRYTHSHDLIINSKEMKDIIDILTLVNKFINRMESEGCESRYNVDTEQIIIERQYDYKKEDL